jgi:hypothetical protein
MVSTKDIRIMSLNFQNFVENLPLVEVPFTVSDELKDEILKNTNIVSVKLIDEFITKYEPVDPDDMTEYIPCFRVNVSDEFITIVYWKAMLLKYVFVLANYSLKGEMIDKKVIAGTVVIDDEIEQIVGTVNEQHEIFVANGKAKDKAEYVADSTKISQFEILDNGRID